MLSSEATINFAYVVPENRLISRVALSNIYSMRRCPLQNQDRATPQSTYLFEKFISNAYLVKKLVKAKDKLRRKGRHRSCFLK